MQPRKNFRRASGQSDLSPDKKLERKFSISSFLSKLAKGNDAERSNSFKTNLGGNEYETAGGDNSKSNHGTNHDFVQPANG